MSALADAVSDGDNERPTSCRIRERHPRRSSWSTTCSTSHRRTSAPASINRGPADWHAVAKHAVEDLLASHPTGDAKVARVGDSGAFDANCMGQVIANLVTNAVKYSSPAEMVCTTLRA